MKYFFLSYILVGIAIVSFAGFRGHKTEKTPWEIFPDMDRQAKKKYQVASNFFEDGHNMRLPVKGTMPIGFEMPSKPASEGFEAGEYAFTHGTGYYHTGKKGDFYGDGFPAELPVTAELIKQGMERYNIHCAICHGTSGNGKGVVSKYTMVVPTDLTGPGMDDATNAAYRPDGKLFDVITNGWNQMGSYGANISVHDRWAIVAYLRTLQYAVKNPIKK